MKLSPCGHFGELSVKLIDDRLLEADQAVRKLGEQLADRILKTLPSADKLVEEYLQRRISLSVLTDVLAFHLPLPFELKLQLLAEPDVRNRVKLLLVNAPSANAAGGATQRYPGDFSEN